MSGNTPILESEKIPRAMFLGFSVIIASLTIAGFIAFQLTHSLQQGLADLATEQFLISRLVHDVQVEENAMTEVLHQLMYFSQKNGGKAGLITDLEESAVELERLAEKARRAIGNEQWSELLTTLHRFNAEMRIVLNAQVPAPRENQERLFAEHGRLVGLINALIRDCSERLSRAETQIDEQSQSLESRAAALIGAGLLMSAICAGATIWFARRSIRRIQWHSEELARVSWQMIQTQEDAARRFSHELHDELGQALAALRSNITKESSRDLDDLRSDCVGLVDGCISNVRELSQLLRPVLLDDFGLDASLRWLADKFSERTRIFVDYQSTCAERFADETETHLFRIAQEALTNVAKHANASRVEVILGRIGGQIRLRISDDGRGLGVIASGSPEHPSLGMVGMRARARNCGGELSVRANLPHGTTVEAIVPLNVRAPAD